MSSSLDDLRRLADEDLMHVVRKGDARAFEILVERHQSAAFALAYRITAVRATAEDVVQEALISLWRSNARYDRARGSVRTWILGIVHNRAIDAVRRNAVHARRRAGDEGLEERFESPERTDAVAARREEAEEVRGALRALPPDQGRVIELAYYGGFTHIEIAELLGEPLGTIKGRMRLGLTKMRGALAAGGMT